MFNIGPEKLLLVMTVGLLVLGPERIPGIARRLGKVRSEIRRLTGDVHPEALQAIRDPRGALLNAVAEPRRAVADAIAEPRLALADAIADFKFVGAGTPSTPARETALPAGSSVATGPAPDDPTLNRS